MNLLGMAIMAYVVIGIVLVLVVAFDKTSTLRSRRHRR